MIFRSLIAACALALASLTSADAATISGQLEMAGTIDGGNSAFHAAGNVDFNDPGVVLFGSGDFAGLIGSAVSLFDTSFAVVPSAIYTVGGFTFTATSFFDFQDDLTARAFKAYGVISAAGFDDTKGYLTFSSQPGDDAHVAFSASTVVPLPAGGLLLIGALGGLAALRRRATKA